MADAPGRNAALTGEAGGIGRVIIEALLERGRRVVWVGRDARPLRQLAAATGDNTFPVRPDITDVKAVDRLPEIVPDTLKSIDILIVAKDGTKAIYHGQAR